MKNALVDDTKVRALQQQISEITRHIGMAEISLVIGVGTENGNGRVVMTGAPGELLGDILVEA